MAVERYVYPANPLQAEPSKINNASPRKVTKSKTVGITRLEATVYITLIIIIAALAITMLTLKMDAYELQADKSQIEQEIVYKNGEIDELTTEVIYLSSYERIYEKAEELGLTLNNSNIKVVKKYEEN